MPPPRRRVLLTDRQRLILQSALTINGGIIEINSGTPERVYRMLAAHHGCLERITEKLFKLTERGRHAARAGYYLDDST